MSSERYEKTKEYIEFSRNLSASLSRARVQAGLTQVDMCREIGVGKSVISKTENVQNDGKITAFLVARYSEITGVSLYTLLGDNRVSRKDHSSVIRDIVSLLDGMSEEKLQFIREFIELYKGHHG